MHVQDIVFIIILSGLMFLGKPRAFIGASFAMIILSIPLFHLRVSLFTAQRLTYYAAAFITLYLATQLLAVKKFPFRS